MTAKLRLVHGSPLIEAQTSLNATLTQTAREVRHLGAIRLEYTTVDETGADWDGRFWHPETKELRMLRYRAIAVFPDGHTVEGDSDEFRATRTIYLADPQLQIQACERLLAKWSPVIDGAS